MIQFIKKNYGKLGMSFALVMLVINYFQRQELVQLRNKPEVVVGGDIAKAQTIDSLQNKIDSLQAEMWPLKVELGRHEMAYEIFMERNPKGAKQYGDIIANETE
jgi:hypothetical protein